MLRCRACLRALGRGSTFSATAGRSFSVYGYLYQDNQAVGPTKWSTTQKRSQNLNSRNKPGKARSTFRPNGSETVRHGHPRHQNRPRPSLSSQSGEDVRDAQNTAQRSEIASDDMDVYGRNKWVKTKGKKKESKKAPRIIEDEEEDDVALLNQAPPSKSNTPSMTKNESRARPTIHIPNNVSIANLSRILGIRQGHLIRKMHELGFEKAHYDYMLTSEDANLVASEYNFEIQKGAAEEMIDLFPKVVPQDKSSWPLRPPIVTIMGHVDHGKTTLLDKLRSSSVAAGEAGGITQRIGAFSVQLRSGWGRITFLDTPGHSAFESMRERGASVTDIVVLVVAADDGVKPQTVEAIKHIKSSGVQMLVAVSKIDRPDADLGKVKSGLAELDVTVEEFGGDVQCVPVSGITGDGIEELENAIVTLAEVLDIRSAADDSAEGWVIESSKEKGIGSYASLIVKRGTLKLGASLVSGNTWCRVRLIRDEAGQPVSEVLPGSAAEVVGWEEPPEAGDEVLEARDEDHAKSIRRTRRLRQSQIQELHELNSLNKKRQETRELEEQGQSTGNKQIEGSNNSQQSLHVVLRADVHGSVEAIINAVASIGAEGVYVNVIASGTGEVTATDVSRAQVAQGKIVAFNSPVSRPIAQQAKDSGVEIIQHSIIYRVIEDVKQKVAEMLPPIVNRKVTGEAEILKLFPITVEKRKTKMIAGCRITNGDIKVGHGARLIRKSQEVWNGKLESLRHHKKIVSEMKKGQECGISLLDTDDIREGDQIQMYVEDVQPRIL